ncbi:MAG: TAXI family TRAP transporter solute-binding subunit [Propionibacteriales bacterium]|nr:TAXI family TRAP transporter solute-binding subunit [Propionibacteriales bacterium]
MSNARRWVALTLGASALAVVTSCDTGNGDAETAGEGDGNFTTSLQLGTGSVGGVYFPLGQEYANLFEQNIEVEDLSVNAVETGASVENIAQINRQELQLGLSQHNTANDAVAGVGEFEGAEIDNVGFIGQLYPEAAQVITLESTGIESISDLKGKRVAIGPPGGGTRAAAEAILAAYDISEGDYQPLEEGFEDAKTKLQDGNADASIEILGVPAASLEELEAAAGGVRLLPIEGDALDEIVAEGVFETYEIQTDSYSFLDEPVSTVTVFACMLASTSQVSEDLGYEITRVIYEHAEELTLPQKNLINIDDALLGQGDVPLHPGAERYFEEQGIL